MYIEKVVIKNIKSIDHFEMAFENPAGWHVLLGDNGSGKSSILKAIALALVGPNDAHALRLDIRSWIRKGEKEAQIELMLNLNNSEDENTNQNDLNRVIGVKVGINSVKNGSARFLEIETNKKDAGLWSGKLKWFSAAFGPFRRFTGGGPDWENVYQSNPHAAAHLSVFGEDVALTESLKWLSLLKYQVYENKADASNILDSIKKLINKGGLLPQDVELKEITSEGVFFKDGNGFEIDVTQLGDGYRSMLSLIFELIRQLVWVFGEKHVFKNIREGKMEIPIPGIVLIDEVDAHLHPLWQTRIGQWFTRLFPNIQFIVTTHSPLICRAAEKGTIWRLAVPGSNTASGVVDEVQKKRLVYGNVLDAYGTDAFGKETSVSKESNDKRIRLAELNIKSIMGTVTDKEETELQELKALLPTEKL